MSSSNGQSHGISHPIETNTNRDRTYPSQERLRWSTTEAGDYRRSGRHNSYPMDQDGYTEERTGAGFETNQERIPLKYSSASRSPSPVSTPILSQEPFDAPMSKSYGEEPPHEGLVFQHHRDYYPSTWRYRNSQEGRTPYPYQPEQSQPYQHRRYDPEISHRYQEHHHDTNSIPSTTPATTRLHPMDSSRTDGISTGALNAVHSSGPSSTASSPRSREISSTTSTYQNIRRRGSLDLRHHSSNTTLTPYGDLTPSSQQKPSFSTSSFGQRHAAHSPSEFSPQMHHSHGHYHHPYHAHTVVSKPSPSPYSKIESLPRPIPMKPASFVSPSTMSHSATGTTLPAIQSASVLKPTVPAGHLHIQSADPVAAVAPSSSPSPSSTVVATTSGSTGSQPPSSNLTDPNNLDSNRRRRGNLPKSVTSVLKSWLVQNAIHPYPTEEEKMRLSEATQLSMNQISNWFINARRRILQPILHEAAAAAVAGTDAPVENVLIVRKGKGSRMHVEMEGLASSATNSSSNSNANPQGSIVSGGGGGGGSSTAHAHPNHSPVSQSTTNMPSASKSSPNYGHESKNEGPSLIPSKPTPRSSSPQPQSQSQLHSPTQPQPILMSS
ncbi:hypothetical protein FBU30_010165 [Linnemannia zychae]|nr:hypothetical protein FBU30_010165 [Linnemannia zychae]